MPGCVCACACVFLLMYYMDHIMFTNWLYDCCWVYAYGNLYILWSSLHNMERTPVVSLLSSKFRHFLWDWEDVKISNSLSDRGNSLLTNFPEHHLCFIYKLSYYCTKSTGIFFWWLSAINMSNKRNGHTVPVQQCSKFQCFINLVNVNLSL